MVLSYSLMTICSNSIKQSLIYMGLSCLRVIATNSLYVLLSRLKFQEIIPVPKLLQPHHSYDLRWHLHDKDSQQDQLCPTHSSEFPVCHPLPHKYYMRISYFFNATKVYLVPFKPSLQFNGSSSIICLLTQQIWLSLLTFTSSRPTFN